MKELIEEGLNTSEEFKRKMSYWVHTRQKMPETTWVIRELCKVIGEEKVIEFLKSLRK